MSVVVDDYGPAFPSLRVYPDHDPGRPDPDPVFQDACLSEAGFDLGAAGEDAARCLSLGATSPSPSMAVPPRTTVSPWG